MNKISKKIVALATMAAFVLTLVPAAAFAATGNAAVDASYYSTVDENVTVDVNDPVITQFELNAPSGAEAEANSKLDNVLFWAENEAGDIVSAATFYAVEADGSIAESPLGKATSQINSYKTADASVTDGLKIAVKFARPDVYTIHAGQVNGDTITEFNYDDSYKTVTVNAGEIDKVYVSGDETAYEDGQEITAPSVFANNTATGTITLQAKAGDTIAVNKEFTISTNNSNITVTPADTVTTDRRGEIEISYTAAKEGRYYITLTSEDGFEVKLVVDAKGADEKATTITAENIDKTISIDDVADGILKDAVQFVIKDQNGREMSEDLTDEPAYKGDKDYVKLLSKPDKFKGAATNFNLVWNEEVGAYTLKYTNENAPLVEGEYIVRVSLYNTGDYADVTFKLGKFDNKSITGLVIDVDDTVVLGGRVEGTVKWVDKNGIEANAKDVTIGYSGAACKTLWTKESPKFAVRANEEEKYVGAKITITAVDKNNGLIETKDIIVSDGVTEGTLAFDPTTGPANEDNTVVLSVVDEDGNVIDLDNANVVAYVAEKSDSAANIDLDYDKTTKDGKAELSLFSDKEGTVDVVVAVTTADKNEIYANTLSFTFGAADVNADKLVAMTINSTDYIVDNEIVAGDAAPYIDSAWRTMVPIRALAETFGATVDFKDNVITIVDGDTTIVMTVGETAYTVNDEEANMDTAPVIGEGDRTFVPVRFVAEALGYTVTPLQDANGLTASVVFQK